ncbi:MAG: PilZ domain-containing protein [Polyangiaceae bacterium]
MRSGLYRKQPRHALTAIASPINGRVLAEDRDDHCFIEKVSVGGAFVRAQHVPDYGEVVTLRFGSGPEAFHVSGWVRWIEHNGFGVQFGVTGARETHRLAQIVLAA